ncbi:hypothetical protein HDU97_006642 [Phlyctochytrium planicorne]|nr:hypothetical protein HDU97_006642 [Phlyctochytrium planicorne]
MFSSSPPPNPLSESDLKRLVFDDLIREAGVDFESQALLVFYSCFLPDPRAADYDLLLTLMLERLDQFVEKDYAIVLFASGLKHQPSWAWIFKAYQRLSRKYRKNLKNLYIVHPSLWAKLLLQMMGTIISPKFAKKVVWVNGLSILKNFVPIANLYIPDVVLQANDNFETAPSVPKGGKSPEAPLKIVTAPPKKPPGMMFGVSLETLMGSDCSKGIPAVISDTVAYLRGNGLESEGIFRRSPSSQLLNSVREAYDRGETGINFEEKGGLHVAAVLLKLFFRELPKPIFESDMYDIFKKIEGVQGGRDGQVNFIKTTIFPLITLQEVLLLRYVFELLNEIHLKADKNLMNSHNLTIIWAPNLIRGGSPVVDMAMCTVGSGGGGVGTAVKLMIEEYATVFSEVISTIPSPSALPIYEDETLKFPTTLTTATTPGTRPRKENGSSRNRNSVLGESDAAMDTITKGLADKRLANASKGSQQSKSSS